MVAGVYLFEAPSTPRFLFGVVKKFLLVRNLVKYTVDMLSTQPDPPPPLHTV